MWFVLLSLSALAAPSRGDVVRDGRYVPVSASTNDQVLVEVELESRVDSCDRTGGRWTWCVFPKITVRNPSDQVLAIDANQFSADWSADGSTRPIFPIDHEHDATFAYPPVVLAPFGMWTSSMSRLNPNRWGKKLSFDEGMGLDRIYEPGNELTVTFPVERDGARSWFSQRFVLEYDGPMEPEETPEAASARLLMEDPGYRRVRVHRNLARAGWITGIAVGGVAGSLAYLRAQPSDTEFDPFAGDPVPVGVVAGVALTGAVVGFIIDRTKTHRLRSWPVPAPVAEPVASNGEPLAP